MPIAWLLVINVCVFIIKRGIIKCFCRLCWGWAWVIMPSASRRGEQIMFLVGWLLGIVRVRSMQIPMQVWFCSLKPLNCSHHHLPTLYPSKCYSSRHSPQTNSHYFPFSPSPPSTLPFSTNLPPSSPVFSPPSTYSLITTYQYFVLTNPYNYTENNSAIRIW